ncbi:complement component C8 alpha chain [Nothobranchius furzeri]|uniref:Complement C8 alpha chain n=1 Tax=Nothobranchius furzeri TaxID=105023 RepID=A0A8C6L2P6_NOTFU|nr:complement component C8 alpha chain [Nothobranchius furzeri]KAF7223129.1 complement component 8 alpha subunit [Nothobranchius furzeri]
MALFNNVLLGMWMLNVLVNEDTNVDASRRPWTTANSRRARAVSRPVPINCVLGSWSSWTPCDSCTDEKFRWRSLEKPSQFGGGECVDLLWDRLACPTVATQCLVPDYCGESFTCTGTGRCIRPSLRCNGEPDCDDFSDENNCESFNRREDKCSTLITIPGSERGTQGFNILTGDFMNQVLDPKYFGGECEYVYNGEWRKFKYDAFCESLHYNEDEKNYRKPYNYHTYRFVAEATSRGSEEYFEDMQSLLKARKSLSSFNAGVTLGIQNVKLGLEGSQESEFLSNVTKYQNKEVGFVRLWSKVETAHFKMRTNQLMLHEDFYMTLMELPEQYDFGMYSHFLNTFGTHYVTEGTMGGTMEYVFIINKKAMAKSEMSADRFKSCFGASIGFGPPTEEGFTAGARVKGTYCDNDKNSKNESSSSSSAVEDVVTLVKGGVTETGSGLKVIRSTDTYKKWGASLKYNPALTDFEVMPIYELVRFSTAADHAGARVANLQRAVDEYLMMFNPCRCAPCRNNGIPVLSGTSCSCICKSGYWGEACEETLGRDIRTDGSWSCWGVWSSCVSRRKTRTRLCNNPAPEGGGATCLGSSTQSLHC